MTTWARNVDDRAVDVTTRDPATIFHADLAATFIVVPDGTETGASYDGTHWTNPAPPAPLPAPGPVYQVLQTPDFFMCFTPLEEAEIRGSNDPVLITLLRRADDPRTTTINMGSTAIQEWIGYLSVTNQSPAPAAAWQANHAYGIGDKAAVGTKVYSCTTAGTSAATGTGPSGTGAGISDGSVVWGYTPTPYIAPARVAQILAGIPQ